MARTFINGAGLVATISNGRSRPLSTFLYAAACAATACAATAIVLSSRLTEAPRGETTASVPLNRAALAVRAPASRSEPTLLRNVPASGEVPSAAAIVASLITADPLLQWSMLEKDLPRLVLEDAEAAARLAATQPDPRLREAAMRIVAQRWASSTPDAAVRWAESLADTEERDRALEHIALELASGDLSAALDALSRRSASPQPDEAQTGVILGWASVDFDAALRWMESQPPSPSRDETLQRLVFAMAQADPPAAARIADYLLAGVATRTEAFASIGRIWAERDPFAAEEWARSLEPESQRRVAAELALVNSSNSFPN
jgi:hypothetical protein